ncbi:glycoside hydrolase family 15 [Ruania suaedae]|uniref:glycoside hydrolase family 15 n=1 Tax=Ruania suaedae TaxID=2897774 RepID=UPI001E57D7E7|nr:glycoside hydrolase family 15 [Ruania suaedae]UFU03546.1 glycoside hydrolase family 15 [Ruania suaedae]
MSGRLLPALCGAVLVAALVAVAVLTAPRTRADTIALYHEGIGLSATGELVLIPEGEAPAYLPGSRVLAPAPDAPAATLAGAEDLAEQTRAWMDAGSVPGAGGRFDDLATDALLDLHALLRGGDGAIAGAMPRWHYVWPRDAAFIASGLSATGHHEDALEVLTFLQQVQAPEGTFHARYTVADQLPPDGRGLQTDGTGWALWALDNVVSAVGPTEQQELLDRFAPLLDRSTAFLLAEVAAGPLPAPSADYWEHQEHEVTLGTAAPVLAGLEAAAHLHGLRGTTERASEISAGAAQLREAIAAEFGTSGYGRYPGRSVQDAAAAFVLPPYVSEPLPGAASAWRTSIDAMARPAGGLAPGAAWPETQYSWTPQTALYAWTAASMGDDDLAMSLLTWIDEHRTATGAIPEKVGPDGAPAAVAPLAWTCALVLLTLHELEQPDRQ